MEWGRVDSRGMKGCRKGRREYGRWRKEWKMEVWPHCWVLISRSRETTIINILAVMDRAWTNNTECCVTEKLSAKRWKKGFVFFLNKIVFLQSFCCNCFLSTSVESSDCNPWLQPFVLFQSWILMQMETNVTRLSLCSLLFPLPWTTIYLH